MIIEELLLQYGLAGIVIWLFYTLVKNDLKHIAKGLEYFSEKIDENTRAIYELKTEIEKLVLLLRNTNKSNGKK